ncbi:tetratricopeptide repeat protein [Leptolyngbya sp. PL-A3]|uniref:tetratricopeptide repeat protein n=1 Tax=Leptolyngbya sp. PL-A3 TaxID=2933911 RepID=UPI003297956D
MNLDDRSKLNFKEKSFQPIINFTVGGKLTEISSTLQDGLPEEDFISLYKISHYLAAETWQTNYALKDNLPNLEKIRDKLEAFYHFSEASLWRKARDVVLKPLDLLDRITLLEQLDNWAYYHELIDISSKLLEKTDDSLDCILLGYLGSSWGYLGENEPAISYYEAQLETALKLQDFERQAQAYGGLGRVYSWCLGDYNQAICFYKRQLEIGITIGNRKQEAMALAGLGNCYDYIGQLKNAIQSLKRALLIVDKDDSNLQTYIKGCLGSIYSQIGRYDEGIKLIEEQLQFSQKNQNSRMEWIATSNLGTAYLFVGRYQDTLLLYKRALAIAEETQNQNIKISSHKALFSAQLLIDKSNLDRTTIEKHVHFVNEIVNPSEKMHGLINIAHAYSEIGEYDKAKGCIASVLLINKAVSKDSKPIKAIAAAVLGNIYWEQGKYIRGIFYVFQSLLIVPPWRNSNAQMILKITIRKIESLIRGYLNHHTPPPSPL